MINAPGLKLILIASSPLWLASCSDKNVTATVTSPNQFYKAVVMVRTCGEQPVTEVMLEPQSFWHFANHQLVWAAKVPPSEISVSWKGNKQLNVSYPQATTVTQSKALSMGVALEFNSLNGEGSGQTAVATGAAGV